MRMPWLTMALFVLLAGCADHDLWRYVHKWTPGYFGPPPDPDGDFRKCIAQFDPSALPQYETSHRYPNPEHAGKSEVETCMDAKGWTKLVTPWFP
jgi:hypothetical protein